MVRVARPSSHANHAVRRRGRFNLRTVSNLFVFLVLGFLGFWLFFVSGVTDSSPQLRTSSIVSDDEHGAQDPMEFMIYIQKRARKMKPKPNVEFLGVLVDAGRNFYPVEWLEALIDYMALLGYNWLHLRLSDDQAFAVHFDLHPTLATPCPQYQYSKSFPTKDKRHKALYSKAELKHLVRYAYKRDIRIVPEINIPGHAASWANIPGMVVPCPKFTCAYGYGIPLNVSSFRVFNVIRNILIETKEIFDVSKRLPFYLHLGGDEVDLAEPCWKEANATLPDYSAFEQKLSKLLEALAIDQNYVLRWEQSKDDQGSETNNDYRAGELTHYWLDEFDRPNSHLPAPKTFFVSNGLYMDKNGDESAWNILQTTRKLLEHQPLGLVVSAFELDAEWWELRNVFGRMMAVAMAVRVNDKVEWPKNETLFQKEYTKQCNSIIAPSADDMTQGDVAKTDVCGLFGQPPIPFAEWRTMHWEPRFNSWKKQVCLRLTDEREIRQFRIPRPINEQYPTRQAEEVALAKRTFVQQRLKEPPQRPAQSYETNEFGNKQASREAYVNSDPPIPQTEKLFTHKVGHTGVTIDLARYFFPVARLKQIISLLSKLGFNTLHLRLSDDNAFAVQLESHPALVFPTRKGGEAYSAKVLKELTSYAHLRGVAIIPELNVVTRAGGWFTSGFLNSCPEYACDVGTGIVLNLTDTPLFAVISNVIEELRIMFNSPFLHLGYDERHECQPCLKEAKVKGLDFDKAERALMTLMTVLGIPSRLVIRWESSEYEANELYNTTNIISNGTNVTMLMSTSTRQRAGLVTHFHSSNPPKDIEMPFFVSTDLRFDRNSDRDAYDIYKVAKYYSSAYDNILGLLGGTLEMGPQAWNGRNVEGKLVAMAIGASHIKDMSEQEFRELYRQTGETLRLEGDYSDLFGKSRWTAEHWKTERETESKRMRKETCNRLTGLVTKRVAKKRILAP